MEADGSHLQLLISDTVLSGDWQSVLPGLEPTGTPLPAVSPEPAPTATASPSARALESGSPSTRSLGRLAYAVDGDIFLADWDGQNPVRIADGLPGGKSGCGSAGYWAEGRMWSPDGRYLAYRSPRSQVDCSRPEANTVPTVILSDPTGNVVASVPGVGWNVAWSPDSTRFATWLDLYPMTKIGVYGLDGERQAVVTLPSSLADEMNGDYDPIWSTNGESLLIKAGWETVELPIDGSPVRRIPVGDPQSWTRAPMSSSPDGTQIAYVVGNGLVVAATDGSEARTLDYGIDQGWFVAPPVWSPSGDRIAFVGGDLRVVDVASTSVTVLVPDDPDSDLSVIAFSPAGDRILFSRSVEDRTKLSLWSVAADGSDLRRLVDGTVTGDWQ